MKTKFIQAGYALVVPVIFIGIFVILNLLPFNKISKYGLGGLLITLIALGLTYLAVKKEKTSLKAINFYIDKKTPLRFFYGLIIGVLVIVTMLFVVINFSELKLTLNETINVTSLFFGLFAFFMLAYMEEVIFRGYAFFKVNNHLGVWPAQIILALLFAWYHDFTGATFFNQLLGPGIWALIFGLVTLRSKGIAFATGMHMALNAVQGMVGLKENSQSIWTLEYTQTVTPELQSQTETVGVILQVIILIVGIVLTEKYRRTIKKNKLN